jgi:hypothetical protein
MGKSGRGAVITTVCASLLGGCVVGVGPIIAPVTVNMKGPVSAGSAAGSPKVGKASAWGLGFFGTGDASISAAMQNGGITRIHHVDHETLNIIGIYAKYTTIVYGE